VGEKVGVRPAAGRYNRPGDFTSFIGRREELAKIEALLARHRLVTITGPGGCGKTRSALEAAQRVATRFEDGMWLVELAQVEEDELVAAAVAVALGIHDQPGMSVVEAIAAAIGARHLLLVLDNCEHLIDAAAELCEALLRAGGDTRILATSRERLGVPGEALYRLPPLPVPTRGEPAEVGLKKDAVSLFSERAAQCDPDFVLTPELMPAITTLVTRLDGMPLAIELAAAQLDVLGLDQLVAGLDERFKILVSSTRGVSKRQTSLSAAIEWSLRLLDEDELRAFRRLSVFPAPFTRRAADAAVGSDATDLVRRLVRRSLLTPPRQGPDDEFRYGMLETLRAYGLGQLDHSGERDDVAEAVAAHALLRAERAAVSFETPDDWLAGLWGDSERDNVLDAFEWFMKTDAEMAVRLAVAMGPWWFLRGHYREGQTLLQRALDAYGESVDDLTASALLWLGRLAHDSSDFHAVIDRFERAAELLAAAGPSAPLTDSLNGRTMALLDLGRRAEATALALRALDMARAITYAGGTAFACYALAYIHLASGDFSQALSWAEEALSIDRRRVPGHTLRWAATALADASALTGDLARAEHLYLSTLEECRKVQDRSLAAYQLDGLSRVEIRTARMLEAGVHLEEAIRAAAEIGDRLRLMDCVAVVAVWAMAHRPRDSAVLWGASRSMAESLGMTRPAITKIRDRADPDSAYDSVFLTTPMLGVRDTLGEEGALQADAQGAEMTHEAAGELALAVLGEGAELPQARQPGRAWRLSGRERELIELVAEGLTDKEIAEKLFISVRTVRSHLDRIREKTGARRRADLTRLALLHAG
jgi:predicted ATPase/DNA-binding CsgD family transcriptional regulator